MTSTIIHCSGDIDTYTVPPGVLSLELILFGAGGGGLTSSIPGGLGSQTSGILPVEGGDTLTVIVGCKGDDANSTDGGAGGFGAQPGGSGGDGYGSAFGSGGGGGSTSVIYMGHRLIAGGGGGSSLEKGGDGGNPGTDGNPAYIGGYGGTQTGGGTGGTPNGLPGTIMEGGDGASAPGPAGNNGGGGGGGGFIGGGGGGTYEHMNYSGSGGGGSSYADEFYTNVQFITGVNAGNGSVIITPILIIPELSTELSTRTATTCSSVTDTVTIVGITDFTDATLTFTVFGPNDQDCVEPALTRFSVPVTSAVTTSPSFVPTLPGVYRWRVLYTQNGISTSTACDEESQTLVITKSQPSLAVSQEGEDQYDHSRFVAVTLASSCDITGTLMISLLLKQEPDGNLWKVLATFQLPVNTSGTITSPSVAVNHPGTYKWDIDYPGDQSNLPASTFSIFEIPPSDSWKSCCFSILQL